MTVLERLKAAGYDPAMSLFPDRIGKAGSMAVSYTHLTLPTKLEV